MAMFADAMSNFDLHMRNINTNGLVLLYNHRRPYDHVILRKKTDASNASIKYICMFCQIELKSERVKQLDLLIGLNNRITHVNL